MRPENDHGLDDVEPVPASRIFLVGLLLLLLFGAALLVRQFLGAIVLGLLIGFLMYPAHVRLTRVVRWPTLSATILTILFTLAIVVPLAFIAMRLRDQARDVLMLARRPDGFEDLFEDVLMRLGVGATSAESFVDRALEQIGQALEGAAIATLTGLAHFLAALIVFYFILFFTLRDGERLVDLLREYTPLRPRVRDRLYELVGARVRAIALGTFLVSGIQGVFSGLGWWIFGFPAPVFWGFVMTVIAVLPLGAPFFILLPAGLWALAQGDWFSGIGILVWMGVVVALIDDALRPYIVGKQAGVHPAIVLIGTLGGLLLWGVSGFLLGPLLLSMIPPVLHVWADQRRKRLGLAEDEHVPRHGT